MPRKPRFYLPGVPVHVVQRGHSREPVFFESDDYAAYLYWMKEAAMRYDCAVHAHVLMTNHVHILVTPGKQNSISRMMQYVGRRYVPYIEKNRVREQLFLILESIALWPGFSYISKEQ